MFNKISFFIPSLSLFFSLFFTKCLIITGFFPKSTFLSILKNDLWISYARKSFLILDIIQWWRGRGEEDGPHAF